MIEKRLLNIDETMLYLGIKSKNTITKLIKEGKLKNISLDRNLKFDKNDLDLMIEDQKKTLIMKVS